MERIRRRWSIKRLISTHFTPSGYLVSDMDALLAVIFCNYILVIIFAMTLGLG
jgi:hypothetical protein